MLRGLSPVAVRVYPMKATIGNAALSFLGVLRRGIGHFDVERIPGTHATYADDDVLPRASDHAWPIVRFGRKLRKLPLEH